MSNQGFRGEGFGIPGKRCPHCGSSDVVTNLRMNQTAEPGRIGLAYKAAGIFGGTELLHADLCGACGSVVRFFVENRQRNWVQD